MSTRSTNTKQITTLGMLAAIAYATTFITQFLIPPIHGFLSYDPKDVIISIAGFIFGPLPALLIAVVDSVVEMVTISATGPIGCIMNIFATACFACIASLIYKRKHTLKGAVVGLIIGTLVTTGFMLLWNYLITPIYMGFPRSAVAAMLVPVFLPFNLIKSSLNAAITILIYKPIVTALRKTNLIAPSSQNDTASKRSLNVGLIIVSLVIFITCILAFLVMQGIL